MRSHYTRILILILEIWEFLRLRVGFSKFSRISEVESLAFKKGWEFSRLRFGIKVPEFWELPSKILKIWGENEGKVFEVFWEFLENSRKNQAKRYKKALKIQGFSRILEMFRLRVALTNSQNSRREWGWPIRGWGSNENSQSISQKYNENIWGWGLSKKLEVWLRITSKNSRISRREWD